MSLTIAQAIERIENLEREIAVWKEVEGFLQGFIRQEEQDSVKKVITTEEWKSKLSPPVSIVVPQEVLKTIAGTVYDLELKPRQEELYRLQNLPVQEESVDGTEDEDAVGSSQGEQEGVRPGSAKRSRAKLKVTPENPGARKTGRRLVPKSAGAGSV